MKNKRLIILFGSQARGSSGSLSDTDLAVLADHPLSREEKDEVGVRVARMRGVSEETLDVIDLWNASPLLQHQIGETGKLLEGDASAFIRFRVLAWKRYLDTAKFRRAREQALASYVKGNHS